MSTTSLKLPDDLKQRAANAARELGVSPHAFMVDAIRHAAAAVEQRTAFVDEAVAARTAMRADGLGHDAGEVHDYLRKRLAGEDVARPGVKPWRK